MKVGDKLYCYNADSEYHDVSIGKTYIIDNIDVYDYDLDICIIDDWENEDWYSSSSKGSKWYYGKYFITVREYRKQKLEKIYESNNEKM